MPTALTFNGIDIYGVVLEGIEISPRVLQFHDRKFWGVSGVSRIFGEAGERVIVVPVLLYDAEEFAYSTAHELAIILTTGFIGSFAGTNSTLSIVSESNFPDFEDCTCEGLQIIEGPKKDEAGTLGGRYWAIVLMKFTQLS